MRGLRTLFLAIVSLFCHQRSINGNPAFAEVPGQANSQAAGEIAVLTRWDVGKERVFCVVLDNERRNPAEPPERVLIIYVERHGGREELFRYATMDVPLAAFPTAESNGNLVTVWVGGSALRVVVFHYANGKVQQVLEAGSRSFPELVLPAEGGEPAIITSDGSYRFDPLTRTTRWEWTRSIVFRWDGARYCETTTGFADRLSPLSSLAVLNRGCVDNRNQVNAPR
ncbi:hypothetical protein EG19_10175 [Thermoanaerobaculum aquaticum]|jgi:hypothetical protein|uniref:Uncharacterized protein n=1 Tax=Thermoanaerobaculum aquaticum TaxID=1312852 RepID=A0A062XPW4_9BACT|nr:hypothetical protein EG19_10175 [Thermoanaerobaculum aquaticum]